MKVSTDARALQGKEPSNKEIADYMKKRMAANHHTAFKAGAITGKLDRKHHDITNYKLRSTNPTIE